MTEYKLYPNLPSAPPENPQVAYHLSIIQAKQRGLKNKEQMFKKKYEKYTKILNRLMWLNACSSRINIATGISTVATFATLVGLPVSISLGAAFLTGVITSGIISMLTKKYQKKLKKVTPLIDIVTWATVVGIRTKSPWTKPPQTKSPGQNPPGQNPPKDKIPLGQNPPGQNPPSIFYIYLTVLYFNNSSK